MQPIDEPRAEHQPKPLSLAVRGSGVAANGRRPCLQMSAPLPPELRFRIWKFATPTSRIVYLYQNCHGYFTNLNIPAIFHACSECRTEALRIAATENNLLTIQPHANPPLQIYFNYAEDILHIVSSPLTISGLFEYSRGCAWMELLATLPLDERSRIQRLGSGMLPMKHLLSLNGLHGLRDVNVLFRPPDPTWSEKKWMMFPAVVADFSAADDLKHLGTLPQDTALNLVRLDRVHKGGEIGPGAVTPWLAQAGSWGGLAMERFCEHFIELNADEPKDLEMR
ncbi:uncharacterized protein BDZ99DRAFT_569786 [Mytilinidion resinicola]|uniref:2EXR domain-containing protein n=1 Tax=Mytilinidion resinicola TaxID=574789 RepID=A0A6A6YTH9_9PEZI|nr:uncharacterized protein BDZ99DRAFT_569786 [Mytilinidion resinicola]KAF2811829.1 hypothetical protein BDZ99DRAFT_569786 [Mytilinidion resinicola]